eukprot:gene6317-10324_t
MSSRLESNDLDGLVVLVTGSGRGLGREYALSFAAHGAKVVVNDYGGATDGSGNSSSKPADEVVKEIETKYGKGKSFANYDSVENGDRIINEIIQRFGRIDILINNAGILRDKSFSKMTEKDWDLVYQVHMKGSFKVTHAAWPHMKKNKFGRIIFISSSSGIYGNFGQANYAMAKSGFIGLGQTLAIEGYKDNIHCNIVAPVGSSRILASINPTDLLKPAYVSPLMIYLCHPKTKETGGLFECGGGFFTKLKWFRTEGYSVNLKEKNEISEKLFQPTKKV